MENQNPQERVAPVQYGRASRAFRQFKNPPQPHMCIQDTIKDTTEKLYINVLGWQKIANPKQYSDPIPLYGGMQVPQGCGPNSNKPPMLVFAVMVNPDILKANGKNANSPTSENLASGPYDSEWWAANFHQRRDVLLLAGQLRMKNIYSAGPFANLTLSTFINILKGAYSYYTLLRE